MQLRELYPGVVKDNENEFSLSAWKARALAKPLEGRRLIHCVKLRTKKRIGPHTAK